MPGKGILLVSSPRIAFLSFSGAGDINWLFNQIYDAAGKATAADPMSSRAAQQKHRAGVVVQHKRYLSVGDGFSSCVSLGRFLTLVSVFGFSCTFCCIYLLFFPTFSSLAKNRSRFVRAVKEAE